MKNRIFALLLLVAGAQTVVAEEAASTVPVATEVVATEVLATEEDAVGEAEATVGEKAEAAVGEKEEATVGEEEEATVEVSAKDKAVAFVQNMHARSIELVNENPHSAMAVIFVAGALVHWGAEVAYEKLWCADKN